MHNLKGLAQTHPCIFKSRFLREQVDPRINRAWPKAPFGNLRRLWRQEHCRELNPFDSKWCPYSTEDCAMSFLRDVEVTIAAEPRNRVAYFRTVVHRSAMTRADRKPLARESQEGPGYTRGTGGGVETRWGLRRTDTRPTGIRDVLGSLNLGPRQRPPTHGKESTER